MAVHAIVWRPVLRYRGYAVPRLGFASLVHHSGHHTHVSQYQAPGTLHRFVIQDVLVERRATTTAYAHTDFRGLFRTHVIYRHLDTRIVRNVLVRHRMHRLCCPANGPSTYGHHPMPHIKIQRIFDATHGRLPGLLLH